MNKLFIALSLSVLTLSQQSFTAEVTSMEEGRKALIVELMPENAQQVIVNFPQVLIVDFYADWCKPCQAMKPIFVQIADEYKDTYGFASVNIDKCQQVAQEYRINSIPTFAIFNNGKLVDKINGMQTKEKLLERITQALSMPEDLSKLDQQTLNEKLFQAIQNMESCKDIKRILDAGADINVVSSQGFTPLMYAILALLPSGMDVSDLVQFLLDNGASTEFKTHDNKTIEACDYIRALIDRSRVLQLNCEKLVAMLAKTDLPKKSECTSEACAL